MSDYAIGIDLGTTNSCVAVLRNDVVEIIQNERGDRVTPSWVTFTDDVILTGLESVEDSHMHMKNTVFEAKRLIGQKFNDPKVQEDIKNFSYTVFNDLGTPKIRIELKDGTIKEYYPEEISAYILRRMKKIAEDRLNKEVTKAVVTVPAYFNDAQRQATKDAAAIAGFKTVNVINEPTAAALAFNHQNRKNYRRNIVVYDFGGGTFDISIVSVGKGKCEVKATKGDCHLGGTDIDMNLVRYVQEEFEKKYKKEIHLQEVTKRRVKNACENAKKKLSSVFQTNFELLEFDKVLDYVENLTRARLEQLNQHLFNKTLTIMDECLKDSGLKIDAIDEIVLVGGSSRIPKIQKMLEDYFGKNKISKGVNPDEAVAYGAAIHASNLAGDKNEVLDVTSLSLGTNTYGDLMSVIIPRNTPIPAKCIKRYQTIMDNQTTMEFPIYQGEREIASENFELGNFTMNNLTEAPAKSVKVEVCYRITDEGLLNISAIEINAENKKEIVLDIKKQGLSEEQIRLRIEEAERNKENDARRRAFVEEKHWLDTILLEVQTTAEMCDVDDRDRLMEEYDAVSKWLEKAKIEDLDNMRRKKQELKDLISETALDKD